MDEKKIGLSSCVFAAAGLDENKCLAGKTKCVGSKVSGLLKCREKCQKKPTKCGQVLINCETKVRNKFDGGVDPAKGCFAKLEGKQKSSKPETVCTTSGDAAAVEGQADAAVAGLVGTLEGLAPPAEGLTAFGHVYQLATVPNATVVGGSDVVFSNTGPLLKVTHAAGGTTVTIQNAGIYRVGYRLTHTAGVGAVLAIAVNGTVNASTLLNVQSAVGTDTGEALLSLAAGDVLTLRNNSAVVLTTALAPAVSASLTIEKLD